jgi:hypothetical protein
LIKYWGVKRLGPIELDNDLIFTPYYFLERT